MAIAFYHTKFSALGLVNGFLVPATCALLLAVGSTRGIFPVACHPDSLRMVQESIFECRCSLPMALSIFQGA